MSSDVMPGACRMQAPGRLILITSHVFNRFYILHPWHCYALGHGRTNIYNCCKSGAVSVLKMDFFRVFLADNMVFSGGR